MAATLAVGAKLPPIVGVQRSTGTVVCPPASNQRNQQYRRGDLGVIHDKGGRTGHSGESKLNTFLSPLVGAESALALSGGMGEAEGDEAQDEAGKRTPHAPADSPTRGSGHHHHFSTGNVPFTSGTNIMNGHGRRHSYQPPCTTNTTNTSQALAILRRSRTYAIPPSSYKYMIMPGNNSQLVLNALRARKWWAPANSSAIGNGGMHSGCVSGGPVGEIHTFFNFFWEQWSPPKRFSDLKAVPFCTQMLNHLECHQALSQKKNLYLNLKRYCKVTGDSLEGIIPKTFLLRAPLDDEPGNPLLAKTGSGAVMEDEADGLDDFRKFYLQLDEEMSKAQGYESTFRNLWILKPAAFSNRGVGIELATDLQEIVNTVLENVPKPNLLKLTAHTMKRRFWTMRCAEPKGKQGKGRMSLSDLRRHNAMLERQREEDYKQEVIRKRYQICLEKRKKAGWIVQKYIERPLLVDSRKIDIRCFVLITVDDNTGSPIGHVYRDGYIRTSSSPFSLDVDKITDRNIHLTNDAVQKNNASYGKFEAGNKLSYDQFEEALVRDGIVPPDQDFVRSTLLPKMQELVYKSIAATADLLNPNKRRHCFELLGYDFMLDCELNVYLIEVNMNPCLELASPYLAELLPEVIEAVVQLAVDPVFPQPGYKNNLSPFRPRRRSSRGSKPNQFQQVYPRPYDPSAVPADMTDPPAASDDAPIAESTATDNPADNEAASAGGELTDADHPVGHSEDGAGVGPPRSDTAEGSEMAQSTPLEVAAMSPHPRPDPLPASRPASTAPSVAQEADASTHDVQQDASNSALSSARASSATSHSAASDSDGPASPDSPTSPTSSTDSSTPSAEEEGPDSARSMPLHRRLLEMLKGGSSDGSRASPSSTRGTTADSSYAAGTTSKGKAERLLEAKLAEYSVTGTAAAPQPLPGASPRASTRPSTASSASTTIRPITREAVTAVLRGRVRDNAVIRRREVLEGEGGRDDACEE